MRKAISLFVALAMALSLVNISVFAADFSDTQGHWAEDAIDRWSEYGVVNGMGDGTFAPDNTMTRAEMAQTYVNLLGLTEKADISQFTDVSPDDWYADAIAKCVAAGILNGTSATTISPNGTVTREQMFVAFGRAIGVTPAESSESDLSDLNQVSDWAEGMVNALLEAGYISGMGDNTLQPLSDINRASMMALMDKSVAVYANEAGATVETEGDGGLVLVVADDVTVTGSVTDVVVAQGAAGGTVTLADATVTGAVTLAAADTQLAVTGETKVENVVVAAEAQGAQVTVAKDAAVTTVTTAAEDTTLEVSGKVESVAVAETAGNATVSANKGAQIDSVTTAGADTTVSGSGSVGKVETTEGSTGATVTTPGTTVENNGSGSVTTDKGEVKPGETGTTKPSTPSGGSSTPSHTAAVLTTNIGEQTFYVGVPTEFTFTTTANDDAGKMVIGSSNFSDTNAIEKLEYYEVKDGNWYELKGDFGPSTGFPMSNATSRFRVTFETAGDYTFTASMKLADGGAVLCSTNVSFTVSEKPANLVTSEEELNAALAGEEDTITLGASFDAAQQITVSRPVTIDGNGKTITSKNAAAAAGDSAGILVTAGATIKNLTVSGPNNTESGWDEGEYGIKVYGTTGVKLENVTVTAANAGIQVNSSEVTLAGTITVSGNEFGGIEVCKSSNEGLSAGTLNIGTATIVCNDTNVPAIWIDGLTAADGTVTGADKLFAYQPGDKNQIYYFTSLAEIGTATIPSGMTLTVDTLTVTGTLTVAEGGTLAINGNLIVSEGGSLINNGTIGGTGFISYIVSDEAGLSKAITAARDGDAIVVNGEIQLENPITIPKDITIDGRSAGKITNKAITVKADVTFKDITLASPTNNNNNASLVYAYDGCETLTFEGVTFSDPQWEAIQVTSKDLKELVVDSCTFTAANVQGAESSYGNTATQAIRYIHIQPKQSDNVVADITITNSTFTECDNVVDSVVGIFYIANGTTLTVGGNTFSGYTLQEDGSMSMFCFGWPPMLNVNDLGIWTGAQQTFIYQAAE